ncbi:hypothetical protein ABH920_008489 [Catenulispora sp. EB89]|uniref:hypothetical protein n=1 Tax=Catenulispora sp. EB89 TaxID=3156257 RepID=UPI003518E674
MTLTAGRMGGGRPAAARGEPAGHRAVGGLVGVRACAPQRGRAAVVEASHLGAQTGTAGSR